MWITCRICCGAVIIRTTGRQRTVLVPRSVGRRRACCEAHTTSRDFIWFYSRNIRQRVYAPMHILVEGSRNACMVAMHTVWIRVYGSMPIRTWRLMPGALLATVAMPTTNRSIFTLWPLTLAKPWAFLITVSIGDYSFIHNDFLPFLHFQRKSEAKIAWDKNRIRYRALQTL